MHIKALYQNYDLLTLENQKILDNFAKIRNKNLLGRLWGIWRLGLYRQTLMGNLGLLVATLFNKL